VQQFAQRLGQSCQCAAQIKMLPFDPAPDKSYAGAVKPTEERRRASFVIELLWPEQPPGAIAIKPAVPRG
jgi:hypothetical protein